MNCTQFIQSLEYDAIPDGIKAVLRRSMFDTLGVGAVGTRTEMASITGKVVEQFWQAARGAGDSRLLFDGRTASVAGAAMYGSFLVDSIDAHDGYSGVKGHAGSAIIPGVLALVDRQMSLGLSVTGADLLCAMAIGYEVAYRSGLVQHATVPDYHTSGAWTAVGLAAAGARLLGLDTAQTRHAMGIAEYHGPRSQMMRCIEYPSMVRDGVGWGAPSGIMAVLLAQGGFTGAPAITVEAEQAHDWWHDLGERWEISETHYKRYPVCRWAHPAIDAARLLMSQNDLNSEQVVAVRIETFKYAVELGGQNPKTLDEMTYGIIFPVAIMIARGRIGVEELQAAVLEDPEICRISNATQLLEDPAITEKSIKKRWARLTLQLSDGREFTSELMSAKGDPDDPLSDAELAEKYHLFADPVLGASRAESVKEMAGRFDTLSSDEVSVFFDLVLEV